MRFSKYHHLGNDFILLDCISQNIDMSETMARLLCDRHLGIGADGIILLKKAKKHDFAMEIFNSDGSKPNFCGNGFFSLLKFIDDLNFKKEKFFIETPFSVIEGGSFDGKNYFLLSGFRVIDEKVTIDGQEFFHVNSGVPHAVIFVNNLADIDVKKEGKKIRFHKKFAPEGVNVDFVFLDALGAHVRTYERGVEDETFSCGSGAIAVAIACKKSKSKIIFQHGVIEAFLSNDKGEVKLLGIAKCVFNGKIS